MNSLEGWQEISKQPASAQGQGLLFEQGDGLSRSVKKSLDQGQRLLWEAPQAIAPQPAGPWYIDDGNGTAAVHYKHNGRAVTYATIEEARRDMNRLDELGNWCVTNVEPYPAAH